MINIKSTKHSKILPAVLKILILTFITVSTVSAVSIQKSYARIKNNTYTETHSNKAYRVTKTGKNIFILMLDRSMNFFIDPIFEHSEIVKKEYTGFTVFENSIAFGPSTNMSTPSLFGGYEYTPQRLDERSNELLVDKHNEALSVLPKLFSEGGWNVSFTDPCWLNYSWVGDLSVFAPYNMIAKNIDIPGVHRQKFINELAIEDNSKKSKIGIRRNMLYFSFFRILPCEIRRIFYTDGDYIGNDGLINLSHAFLKSYAALEYILADIKLVNDKDCLNIIVNNLTHNPPKMKDIQIIKKDFLIPLAQKYCLNEYTEEHFYANYLVHESCAKLFRFLKENNCWDNTRIIIAGDHGRYSMHTTSMRFLADFAGTGFTPERLIPLIMIKDFNSEGELKKDHTFMTLADIPILATEGLPAELQKNPFTGVAFKDSQNKDTVKIMNSGDWEADKQLHLTQFKTTEDDWVYVKDNVYDPKCWSKNGFEK